MPLLLPFLRPPDHPHVAILLNNIGVLHFKTGDYAGSIRALEESVELQRTTLRYYCSPINAENAIHQLATTMANLAVVHHEGRHHPDRAMSFLQESLALFGSVFTFENDGMEEWLLEYMDRLAAASSSSVLSFTAADLSSRHRSTLSQNSNSSCKNHPAGETPYATLRSTSIFGNSDGIPNKLSVSSSENNHDFLLLGQLENELTPELRVRETVLNWFGKQRNDEGPKQKPPPTPTSVADFLALDKNFRSSARAKASIPVDLDGDNVVNAELHLKEIHRQVIEHLDHNEIDDALDIFYSSLRSHREKYGEIHHLVGTTLHNIGMIQLYQKQYDSAQHSFVEAINVRSAALGTGHVDVASSKSKIALLQLAKGELEVAYESFWDIHDGFLDIHGQNHPLISTFVNNIGVSCGRVELANIRFFSFIQRVVLTRLSFEFPRALLSCSF